jgi:enoyl-CoA hydratase
VIALNQPDKLNAWTQQMRTPLTYHLRDVDSEDRMKAIMLTGVGKRGFCSGQDLSETEQFQPGDHTRAEAGIDSIEALYASLRGLSKPLVVASNEVAAGSGFQAALLGDVRIAHPSVRVGQPEVRQGIPSITGSWFISQAIGISRANEMVLTGRMLDAAEAHAIGIVHEIVDADQVLRVSVERAREMAALPPHAVAATKTWFRESRESEFRDVFRTARGVHRGSYASGEPQRMMTSFLSRASSRRAAVR